MKRMRNVVVWILLSVIAQSSLYLYLDKVRYVEQKTFSTKVIEVGKKNNTQVDIKIPEGAANINVSYDGRYVAYFYQGQLMVEDSSTGNVKKQQVKDGNEIAYYRWLPDEERMFIAEKNVKRRQVTFYSYDVKKDDKNQIEKKNVPVTITLPDSKSEIQDIQLSTLTSVIYVKVNSMGKRTSVYRIDINNDLTKIRTNGYVLGNIATINRKDTLIYEDMYNLKDAQIRLTSSNQSLKINGVKNLCLLSVDLDDTVYLGELDGDKVKRIYSGQLSEPTDSWKVIDLQQPMDKKDLYINNEGKIYYNDNLKGVVIELATGKETSYKGQFYQMYNSGIASISDNKLMKFNFK